jgi:hypothetical protein
MRDVQEAESGELFFIRQETTETGGKVRTIVTNSRSEFRRLGRSKQQSIGGGNE